MGGPWEDYQANTPQAGPWMDYQSTDGPPPAQETFQPGGKALRMPVPDFSGVKNALLTNQTTKGIGQTLLRGLPAQVGFAAFGPPGAAGAEFLRQGAVAAYDTDNPPSALTAGLNVAGAGMIPAALQAAGPSIGRGIAATGNAVINAGSRALKYAGTNYAGVKNAAYELAQEAPEAVRGMVGAGTDVLENLVNSIKTKVGGYVGGLKPNASSADALAERFRSTAKSAADTLKAEYPKQLDAIIQNPKYAYIPPGQQSIGNNVMAAGSNMNKGKMFNMKARMDDDLRAIFRQFQYDDPLANGNTKEAAIFKQAAERIGNLGKATANQVASTVQYLNLLRDKYANAPQIGAAIGKLASRFSEVAGKAIPEIGEANNAYSTGMQLEELASKAANANDLVGYIKTAYSNPLSTKSKESLDLLRQAVPEVDEAIAGIQGYLGKQEAATAAEELAGKLINQNDIAGHVQRTFAKSSQVPTRDMENLQALIRAVPGLEDDLQGILNYGAGREFTPLARQVPPTGFGAAMMKGQTLAPTAAVGAFASGNPLIGAASLGYGALTAGLTSPRLALMALQAGQAAAPGYRSLVQNASTMIPRFAPSIGASVAPNMVQDRYNIR